MKNEATQESLPASGTAAGAGPIVSEKTAERSFGLTLHMRALAGLLIFSLGLTLGLLLWSAKRQDDIAIAGSRHLAESALSVVSSNLAKILIDYTWWDDAYENIAEAFDPDWFDEYFADGPYLRDNFGITASFAVTPDNQVLRHMYDSEPFPDTEALDLTDHVDGGVLKLIDSARRRVDGEFLAPTGLLKVGGRSYVAAARIVQPYSEELVAQVGDTPENSYVTIFMRPLDDELLQSLATDFGLDGLRYNLQSAQAGELTLPLYQVNGQTFGALTWQIDRPSRHVLTVVLPALLAVIATVGLLSGFVLTSLRRGQRRLHDAMLDAQSSDRTKTEFLANMSHELRTPLNAIIGFSESMKSEVFGPIGSERYAGYCADIKKSGEHLLAFVNALLELSNVHAGKFDFDETEVALPEVWEAVHHLIAPHAAKKGISLEVDVPADLPAVFADGRAMKQILLHLLSNAVKFTPDYGRVTLAVVHEATGRLRLTVSDNGVGIPEEQLSLVMQPFQQVSGPLIASGGSMGLSLPLTASLVELHGGEIRIESEVDRGTTVWVDLPAGRVIAASALTKAA